MITFDRSNSSFSPVTTGIGAALGLSRDLIYRKKTEKIDLGAIYRTELNG
ncbi:MAG: hypothetical protein ABRQ23_09720 [Syntrophomonadaceae bacterium]